MCPICCGIRYHRFDCPEVLGAPEQYEEDDMHASVSVKGRYLKVSLFEDLLTLEESPGVVVNIHGMTAERIAKLADDLAALVAKPEAAELGTPAGA